MNRLQALNGQASPQRHQSINRRPWWRILGLLVTSVLLSEALLIYWSQQREQAVFLDALKTANQARTVLESELNAAASLASGVSIYVSALDGVVEPDGLQSMLQQTYDRGAYFRNIGLAPDNIITYVHPLAGNEQALGIDYRELPEQWPVIQDIIASNTARLAGPLELVQGGTGLLYREPILAGNDYWGLLSTVIDADHILQLLDPLKEEERISIAVRGVDAKGAGGAVFLGEPMLFERANTILDIFVPGGSWQMAVALTPDAFTVPHTQRAVVWVLLFVIVGAVAMMMQIPFQRMNLKRLESAVLDRTQNLSRTNGVLMSLLDSAREVAIIATDTTGRITLFNHGAERLLGYSAAEVVNHLSPLNFHLAEELSLQTARLGLDPDNENDRFQAMVAGTQSGQTEMGEWTYHRKDGSTLPVWLIISEIIDDGGVRIGYLGMAQDLTERKRLDRLKDEFISVVSHELRTPVTAISGALSLLRHGHGTAMSAEADNLLKMAERNSLRLQSLISDLLDFSKIEAGMMTVNNTSKILQVLLNEAIDLSLAQAQGRSVRLQLAVPDTPVFVKVDSHRFQQVMANLLSNAIKFSPPGSLIEIIAAPDSSGVRISVIDEGPGIPQGMEGLLFQKFSQLDGTTTRSQGGTGLGLAISRELMSLMDGSIGFEQSNKPGATFWIRLPTEQP